MAAEPVVPRVAEHADVADTGALPLASARLNPSSSSSTPSTAASARGLDSEQALMDRLRAADPANVVALAQEGRRRFHRSALGDERDSREVDALVALGRIQDAHYRAQLFVQHYPRSPYAEHVTNLMGVHARPPGVFPDPPDESQEN